MTREFLALIFHQRRRMTNIDLPRVLVLWEWCEKKEKDWIVLRQIVFIRQSNFLGTLTHLSGRGNTTMIIHNRVGPQVEKSSNLHITRDSTGSIHENVRGKKFDPKKVRLGWGDLI